MTTTEPEPRRLTPTERLHEVTMAAMTRAATPPEHSVEITRNAKGVAQFEVTVRGYDLDKVIAACLEHGKAIEVNCRPDRLDPPKRMLTVAVEAGCLFSIDTDAHAPGQLDWLPYGCERAARCGVDAKMLVNAWPVEQLLEWTAGH